MNGRGNQAYVLASTSIYDEWVRLNYDLQVWQHYLKLGQEHKHWAKDIIRRTKKRDDQVCTRFVQKKINQISAKIAESSAIISNLQVQLGTYWTQTTATNTDGNSNMATTTSNRTREPVDRVEKCILRYIQHCTSNTKKMAESKIQLARIEMEEYRARQDFEQIATPLQWNLHLVLKPKMKQWSTKNKNYQVATKRVELDLPPKFIEKTELSFKIDETVVGQEEAQTMYQQMRQITKDFRTQAMTLYIQTTGREFELVSSEIKRMIEGFPKENDDGFDCEAGYAAFKQYQELREKRINLEIQQTAHFLSEQQVESNNKDREEIVAPTVTRSLGEDFLLQI